jgi:hypothetical protein
MKKELPIEFSLQFNLNNAAEQLRSRNFIFPTAPPYLNEKSYNQKCMVEFISFSTDAQLTANESFVYVIFKGIKGNQFRTAPINTDNGLNLQRQDLQPSPLSLIVSTHTGGINVNNGNICVGTSNPIICDNLWGSNVEIEVRETIAIGGAAANNYRVINGNINCNLVMRVTPFSEEC